jgi:D-arabinose 1-dehydrogenase-like Zn-dependent alcohol dehydrogenase
MTVGPQMPFLINVVLRNIEIKGTAMGSRKEFADMMEFIRAKKVKPAVYRTIQGLDIEAIDGLFEDMKAGKQFGKLVIELPSGSSSRL